MTRFNWRISITGRGLALEYYRSVSGGPTTTTVENAGNLTPLIFAAAVFALICAQLALGVAHYAWWLSAPSGEGRLWRALHTTVHPLKVLFQNLCIDDYTTIIQNRARCIFVQPKIARCAYWSDLSSSSIYKRVSTPMPLANPCFSSPRPFPSPALRTSHISLSAVLDTLVDLRLP